MTVLTDGTITLRPFVAADIPRVEAAFEDPAISTFMEKELPFDAEAWWARLDDPGHIELAVVDADTGEFLGRVTLWDIRRDERQAEIGYWLLPAARGRGAATRAVSLITDHGFAHEGLRRIVGYVKPENPRSGTVLERVGFTPFEGGEYPGYQGYERLAPVSRPR